jgi:hypothetical protein
MARVLGYFQQSCFQWGLLEPALAPAGSAIPSSRLDWLWGQASGPLPEWRHGPR